jgi:hypothetical protein
MLMGIGARRGSVEADQSAEQKPTPMLMEEEELVLVDRNTIDEEETRRQVLRAELQEARSSGQYEVATLKRKQVDVMAAERQRSEDATGLAVGTLQELLIDTIHCTHTLYTTQVGTLQELQLEHCQLKRSHAGESQAMEDAHALAANELEALYETKLTLESQRYTELKHRYDDLMVRIIHCAHRATPYTVLTVLHCTLYSPCYTIHCTHCYTLGTMT